ncbi:hypothetical protein [Streptomyces sp. BPTC-684]|uniref:hypothetical protein n=1 Tax=Streptomyces sp. BPTC-684 TaxID=3043734 RepID=UPI0024B214ED|nr:hypothetical protein [Streptomyces sp. BPTC-684]WHM37559.1 hypothetical protein QIY60_12030 [Streptomyces sp. BPTC-684]
MSLDAMDWVWTRSAAKGIARLVLVAIADKCPRTDYTAYAGTTMLMRCTNASRTGVRTAVDTLIALGELEIVEGARGPRGETVYRLPHAVGHFRSATDGSGRQGAGFRPGPDRGPHWELAPRGAESNPARGQKPTRAGADIRPQNARNQEELKEQQPRATQQSAPMSDEVAELVSALREAGVAADWRLGGDEQRAVRDLVERHGVETLVARALSRTGAGMGPKPPRYWLKVWGDLDRAPLPDSGATVIPLHAAAPRTHRDALAAGLALVNAQEGFAR